MSQLPISLESEGCPSGCRSKIVRCGYFLRKSDRASLQRYQCVGCKRKFSDATFSACFGQKKRHLNETIFRLLCGSYSQRRAAFDLKINRKTVVRKFLFLGRAALECWPQIVLRFPKVCELEFDELETIEHTKLKPLSVILAVEKGTRRILGFKVGSMPAKGHLAKRARKKYGFRPDERSKMREALFLELSKIVAEIGVIKSDQNPNYPQDVKKYLPKWIFETFKSRRACIVGQGELKSGTFDPIFSINHTFAMLRANINRLVRRTWSTTKLKDRLTLHIALYAAYHNLLLVD